MKKILAGMLAAALFCVSAYAHPPVTVLVDGQALSFDQPPVIRDDRTLVPMRAIFQALGAEVLWEESTQTVTALTTEDTLRFRIGDAGLYRNGTLAYTMSVPAQIINDRTLVPIRAIAESFGAVVGWDEASYTVTIQSAGQEQPAEPGGTQTVQNEPKPGGFAAEIRAADGTTVLTVKLECDILEEKKADAAAAVNMRMAEETFAEGQGFLREYGDAALRAYAADPDGFQPYYDVGHYRLTRDKADYASFLATTARYAGAAETKRYASCLYSLSDGREMRLEELVPDSPAELEELWRASFLAMIRETPGSFYRDAENRLERCLDEVGFYLTEAGVAFFLPPERIAPADAGTVAFEVKYTF